MHSRRIAYCVLSNGQSVRYNSSPGHSGISGIPVFSAFGFVFGATSPSISPFPPGYSGISGIPDFLPMVSFSMLLRLVSLRSLPVIQESPEPPPFLPMVSFSVLLRLVSLRSLPVIQVFPESPSFLPLVSFSVLLRLVSLRSLLVIQVFPESPIFCLWFSARRFPAESLSLLGFVFGVTSPSIFRSSPGYSGISGIPDFLPLVSFSVLLLLVSSVLSRLFRNLRNPRLFCLWFSARRFPAESISLHWFVFASFPH